MQYMRLVWGLVLLLLSCSTAYASGDFGCEAPRGALLFHSYDSCNSVPFLSPGNDSRLNLELLLIDAGELKGSLTKLDFTPPADMTILQVPFDYESWQVSEPGAEAKAANPNDPANSSSYAQGEGSRCNSATGGLEAFKNAVNTAGMPKEDAAILIKARSDLIIGCSAATPSDFKPLQGLHSLLAREFGAYIIGADAFYIGDFSSAVTSFTSLSNSTNIWLKETSRYMVARALLNSAQRQAFGEWGDLKLENVDKESLKRAEEAFNSYLRDFPHGTYAVSARGLLRRVYWLGSDRTRLAEAFARAFADSDKNANNVTVLDLVQEADAKLLNALDVDQIESPQILAVLDLMHMRSTDDRSGPAAKASFSLDQLESQKDRFISNPALYQFLLAVYHVYVDDKPDEALALLPKPNGAPLNYFAFSQQMLRVLAMDAANQFDAERKLLAQLLPLAQLPLAPEQLQLAMARLEVHTGHTDRIFAPDSPVQDSAIRTIVVEQIASAEMLRQRVKDPKENENVAAAALYSLLYKELTGGKYHAFQADLTLMPAHPSELLQPFAAASEDKDAGFHRPALQQVAATLEHNSSDAQCLNCVGELVRIHGVHFGQDSVPAATDLGGYNSLFPATSYSRLDDYMKVIANQQADGKARAYALYRAVRCYAPSGYNDCGKQEIPQSTRKLWFQTLHKEYPDSTWAKTSKYYW